MGKKGTSRALKQESRVGNVMIEQIWFKDMTVENKEQGSRILYDEPSRDLDPNNQDTWPPRFVVLSSLWAFKVVREETIPSALRYAIWPTTFSSKAGFQSSWKNNGQAPVVRDHIFHFSDALWKWVGLRILIHASKPMSITLPQP